MKRRSHEAESEGFVMSPLKTSKETAAEMFRSEVMGSMRPPDLVEEKSSIGGTTRIMSRQKIFRYGKRLSYSYCSHRLLFHYS